jgi:uncharacterized protein (TIGR02996 family)
MISNDSRSPKNPSSDPQATPRLDFQGYSTFPISRHLRNLVDEQSIRAHRSELLAQVKANPSSNEARLAYGNYLVEKPLNYQDEARGELIRLQVERGSAAPSEREIEILQKYERTWCKELGGVRSIEWDRGFVAGVTMSAAEFERAGQHFANEMVTHLRIHTVGGSEDGGYDLRDALRAPHFANIQKLSFWFGDYRTVEILDLALSPLKTNLAEVHFEQFADSRDTLVDTIKNVTRYSGPRQLHGDSLSLHQVAITFKTPEEGSRCYFGTRAPVATVAK